MSISFADGERLTFPAAPDFNIIVAAERSGHVLASNCRQGICKTCAARNADDDEVLLCQEAARPGFHARVPYRRAELVAPTLRRAKLNGFERLSRSVWQIRYRLQFSLPFLAGQFVEVSFPGIDRPRRFSMANAPSEAEQLLFVRDIPGGAVSRYLSERAKPNDAFSVRGPFGVFYLRSMPLPKLFVAGGTGLAPILSMLRALDRQHGPGPLSLVFGVADPLDVFALDELRALARRLPLEIVLAAGRADGHWKGRIGTAVDAIQDVTGVPLGSPTAAYICGPPPMVAAASGALLARGLDRSNVMNEEFDYRP